MKLKQLRCPSCGAGIDIELRGRDSVFCPYCGSQFAVDDGNRTITHNININKFTQTKYTDDAAVEEARRKDKENERDHKETIMLFVIIIFGMLSLYSMSNRSKEEKQKAIDAGMIQVGQSSEDMEGKNYEELIKQLESAGFKNIKTFDLDDAILLVRPADTVESVSIGGKTTFSSDDFFDPESVIVISYH